MSPDGNLTMNLDYILFHNNNGLIKNTLSKLVKKSKEMVTEFI